MTDQNDYYEQYITKVPDITNTIKEGRNAADTDPYLVSMAGNPSISNDVVFKYSMGSMLQDPVTPPLGADYYTDRMKGYYLSIGEPVPQGDGISRRPDTGEFLKMEHHPSFHLDIRAVTDLGATIYRRNDPPANRSPFHNRIYSFSPEEWSKQDQSIFDPVPRNTVEEWRFKPYNMPALREHITQTETYQPLRQSRNGWNSNTELFYPYSVDGHSIIGIGTKIDGNREEESRNLVARVAPHINWNELKRGEIGLTEDEVRELADIEIKNQILKTERSNYFPLIYRCPEYLQNSLINGVFLTFYRPEHKTTRFIRSAQEAMEDGDLERSVSFYRKAANESLNRGDYRDMEKTNPAVEGTTQQRYENYKKALTRRANELQRIIDSQTEGGSV